MERHPYLREAPPPFSREPIIWPYTLMAGIFGGAALWAWFVLNFIPAIALSIATWGLVEVRRLVKTP